MRLIKGMRLILIGGLSLLCTLLASAQERPKHRIELESQVDKTRFPDITFRFRIVDDQGLPAKDLPAGDIVVLEDGEEVQRIHPKRLKTEPLAVVLVIDTSGSMLLPAERAELVRFARSKRQLRLEKAQWRTKMDEAKRAAERFFQKLDPATPCGLVLFNHRSWRTEPITSAKDDLGRLVQAIEVDPNGGTAIWDALDHGIDLLVDPPISPAYQGGEKKMSPPYEGGDKGGVRQRVLVLMTDGIDNASRLRTLAGVIDRAREQNVRIYAIGLGEVVTTRIDNDELPPDLDENALKQLSGKTGGQYHHVQNAEKLAATFERVAVQMEHSYPVTYRTRRDFHDGTSRGIVIRLGDAIVQEIGYTTHGLITPTRDHGLYVALLAILGLLLVAPSLLRRLGRPA